MQNRGSRELVGFGRIGSAGVKRQFEYVQRGRAAIFDYRVVLRLELEKRTRLSPKYSMRDFAKDLGLFPSHLFGVLKKTKGLSPVSALKVAWALGFDKVERDQFVLLVRAWSSRARWRRHFAMVILLREKPLRAQKKIAALCLEPRSWKQQVLRFLNGEDFLRLDCRLRRVGISLDGPAARHFRFE